MGLHDVVLSATGLFTPPHSISNEELVEAFNKWVAIHNELNKDRIAKGEMEPKAESSAAFIEKASGIKSRYAMDKAGVLDVNRMRPRIGAREDDEISVQAEMGVAAARDALNRGGVDPAEVDMVVLACSNMQRPYPAVSVEIQNVLGAKGFAYDMNVACSSATFGLQAAVDAIRTGSAKRALVVNSEICTAHLNFTDRDSHFIFGDAATAMLVERADLAKSGIGHEILGTSLETTFSNNIRNNFGFLNSAEDGDPSASDKLFMQKGRQVFREVCPAASRHILDHLKALDLDPAAIKRFWLHQANKSMNDLIAKRVLGREVTVEEAPLILDTYANTSSAGSVIALHLHSDDLAKGDLGVLCSFGAGYSIGSAVLRKI